MCPEPVEGRDLGLGLGVDQLSPHICALSLSKGATWGLDWASTSSARIYAP
jgi:hypothetical protein